MGSLFRVFQARGGRFDLALLCWLYYWVRRPGVPAGTISQAFFRGTGSIRHKHWTRPPVLHRPGAVFSEMVRERRSRSRYRAAASLGLRRRLANREQCHPVVAGNLSGRR